MIKYTLVILFSVTMLNAQKNVDGPGTSVIVGDVFEIGRPEINVYKHIDFPSADFIVKNGGNANYKLVEGKKVVVTSVREKKDGTILVKIKRNDGERFFGSLASVSVNFNEALDSGELKAI